ncbi:MAG: hypothetical protein ACTSQN_16335 [Candidatus Heimdallarchaeota archaeon]
MTDSLENPTEGREESSSNIIKKLGLYFVPIFIGVLFFLAAIIALIVSIVLQGTSAADETTAFFIVSGALFFFSPLFILFGFVPYSIDRKNSGNDLVDKLEKLRNLDLSKNRNKSKFTRIFYNLLEDYPEELAKHMSDNLEFYRSHSHLSQNGLNQMLFTLAYKLGYNHINDMIGDIRGTHPRVTEKKKENIEEKIDIDVDLSIRIEKVYFIKEIPPDSNCMIKGLPIDIKNDVIVACPHCGNMAEKDLLMKWVKENEICPICKKTIFVNDIPIVILKN